MIWGGEFGRTPMSEKGDGRDHNPYGFTMWLAGGGVKGGQTIGTTDELGLHAVEDRLHVHDLHATILHLLGLDHMQLVYRHKGRPERPTLNEGVAVREDYQRLKHTPAFSIPLGGSRPASALSAEHTPPILVAASQDVIA